LLARNIENKGYQYWALGHVHNRQILCIDPYIVYPENIQGRHGKEQGEKSCELVTVADAGTVSIEPIYTSVVPWVQAEVDASGCQTADDVYEKVRTNFAGLLSKGKERVTALRLRILGTTDAHTELNRDPEQVRNEAISIANECGNGLLWVERVQVATLLRLDREALLTRDDPIGEIVRIVAGLRHEPTSVAAWDEIAELQKKLPSEIAEGADPVKLDCATLSAAIEEAEGLLLARLSCPEAL
jgi:exonuclease SbcD